MPLPFGDDARVRKRCAAQEEGDKDERGNTQQVNQGLSPAGVDAHHDPDGRAPDEDEREHEARPIGPEQTRAWKPPPSLAPQQSMLPKRLAVRDQSRIHLVILGLAVGKMIVFHFRCSLSVITHSCNEFRFLTKRTTANNNKTLIS